MSTTLGNCKKQKSSTYIRKKEIITNVDSYKVFVRVIANQLNNKIDA